jgi:hypothetical protein
MEDKAQIRPLFSTVTGDDFRKAIARAKTETNSVREQIKQIIDGNTGTTPAPDPAWQMVKG